MDKHLRISKLLDQLRGHVSQAGFSALGGQNYGGAAEAKKISADIEARVKAFYSKQEPLEVTLRYLQDFITRTPPIDPRTPRDGSLQYIRKHVVKTLAEIEKLK